MEEWRTIPFLESYEASSLGRIRSKRHQRPLKLQVDDQGYATFCGYPPGMGGKNKMFYVSRCVCAAFHGMPPEGKPFALHGDDTPLNNVPSNLHWGTPKENSNAEGMKAKLRALSTGRVFSKETREKISIARRASANKGFTQSE